MGSPAEALSRVEELLAISDIVKASAEDVAWLLPGRELEDVAAEWLAAGPALVAITRALTAWSRLAARAVSFDARGAPLTSSTPWAPVSASD